MSSQTDNKTVEVFFRSQSGDGNTLLLDDFSFYDENGSKLPVESVYEATNPLFGGANHNDFNKYTQSVYRLDNLID